MAKYLKSITLQGFKSFPIKTNIEFVNGITGIVGANGSGKSNVVEALKWVLGEQSAKSLRGDKMEDVIFNGTKDRSPGSMAEVSLVFDNENHWLPIDYSEVSVSRRIFRSGEGQYGINKSKVRLKDVVELFLDTGVGRDSYAIFEQGKIDRLLSESPTDRRSLFEDFAGISKFKFRKEEAERKLENSRTNLERVTDVMISLEKEVVSLKEQAENASRYNEMRSMLRDFELKFEALRVHNFENEIMTKYTQKKNSEEKLKPLMEEIKEKEEGMIRTENEILEKETEFNQVRDAYARMEREFGEIKSRLESNRERKIALVNQLKGMENRLSEGNERQKVLKAELEDKMSEIDTVTEDKETVQDGMLDIQSKIDSIHGQIRQLDSQILVRSKEMGFEKIISKDDIERQKHEMVTQQAKHDNYRQTMEEKFNQSRMVQSELDEKKGQFEISSQEIEKLKTELEKILSDIQGLHQKEADVKADNIRAAEEIRTFQTKLKSMDRVIMESLEKQSVQLKEFTGKKPLLEAKLESVMEELNGCILDDKPIDVTRGVVARLRENFREYQGHYENILGILYSDEGTYTQKENAQKSIEELTGRMEVNEKSLEEIRARIREFQVVRENIQSSYNKSDFEQTSLKNDIKKMMEQQVAVQEALKILENQINATSEIIKKKQTLIEQMIQTVDEYDEEIRDLKNQRNELFESLNKKKIDFARVEEKQKSLQNEINRIKNQVADIEKMRQSYETDRNNSIAVIAELEKRIADDSVKMEEDKKKIEDFEQDIENRKSQIDGLQKARKVLEFQRREIEANIQKLERNILNIENAISERKGFLDSIIENVQKTHGMDVRNIQVEKAETFDLISVKINELRRDLQSLGDVNLLAIEQFQNAKERLEFLTTQKQDSERAMEDILALINETNMKCMEQFVTAFEDIRKAFKKIFARLFDGGRADLVLENPDDVLNSGINIFAEPPGKKFQTITLLSGGERALVAIAVIFSILYLKPTPFVVLDEMDAPLDDDNIERFKAIVKDFRETSQFVLVSHSKSTLEICDALYGVTMEEQGVSKIVNVAFDEAELLFKSDEPMSGEPKA